MYSDEFLEEMNKNTFYANPKRTQIYIIIDSEEILVGNAVVMNLDHSNEKIPVYSYNSDLYAKYLNGKNIITGSLALRKTTVDRILSIIDDNADEVTDAEMAEISDALTIMNKLSGEELDADTKASYNAFISSYKESKLNALLKAKQEASYSRKESGFEKDLLYIAEQSNTNIASGVAIRLDFEDNYSTTSNQIKDVLFVRKQTELSVNRNDIIEVYQFIGNPGTVS
jgi:hypothetical protein